MGAPRLFALNFDAELELARGPRFQPTAAFQRAAAAHAPLFARHLAPGDLVLDHGSPGASARVPQCVGRAYCPTPRALAALRDAGARVPHAPSENVLRVANHRQFLGDLLGDLPGACFVTTEQDAWGVLSREPPRACCADGWIAKRALSAAGRGKLRVRPTELPTRALQVRAFLRGAMREGGLVIEPRVRITAEYSIHGYVSPREELLIGAPCVLETDVHGAFVEARLLVPDGSSASPIGTALHGLAEQLAARLVRVGFHGPFGIDTFCYATERADRLRLVSELNARYTMAWPVGMGMAPGTLESDS